MVKFGSRISASGFCVIYLYPANKMENLLALFNQVQQVDPLPIFNPEIVIVQNAGMQHWLNMSVAQERGVSLNIHYALPAQFLWKLLRSVAYQEKVPEQSLYSREVLSWRIYQLLADDIVIEDPDFSDVKKYCTENNTQPSNHELKRYQLAVQLADLYEQYLIFRPDWLHLWQQGDFNLCAMQEREQQDESLPLTIKWQAKLWYYLQQQQSYNPQSLLSQATENLATSQHLLPKRMSFFGINAMAPMWLDFIYELSKYTQVHFFHLNPCADYWGDLQTEKQQFNYLKQWILDDNAANEHSNELDHHAGINNPLLANLGQQGREFLALLENYSSYHIEAFERLVVEGTTSNSSSISVLQQLQQDILTLADARQTPKRINDESITITSAHSALREVQGLHDWLLHQFNQLPDLTPKDVLVMCPQIEHYAPYVDAVFSRGWQDIADDIPPLPCSLADRVSKNSEPLVVAFLDLLASPDSRFQVSQILAFLRLSAVQTKFNLSDKALEKITLWLQQAAIHWGLNSTHKQKVIGGENTNANFTWQDGLSKLMRGFAYADQDCLFEEQLLLGAVEGDDVVLLGQMMLILELLQHYSSALSKERSPEKWQQFLYQLLADFFNEQQDELAILTQAIDNLVEYSQAASLSDALPLVIVQDFLNHHFSQPDPGRQFMVGQVTFCSMLPMRSIPFKIIAVLGLNDGEFPRQRKPLAFDLLQHMPARLGDRSRRGDDRYLFLEAIISARHALYLSYQGRNIKNNSERQPSLVLKELTDYLVTGYQWDLISDIRQLPMQAFSWKNYLTARAGYYPSFDKNWHALAKQTQNETTEATLPLIIDAPINHIELISLSLSDVIRFYQHPAKYFAEQQLDLTLQHNGIVLKDQEPFAVEQLVSYQFREALTAVHLSSTLASNVKQTELNNIEKILRLQGQLPDQPSSDALVEGWQQDSEHFADEIKTKLGLSESSAIEYIDFSLSFTVPIPESQLIHEYSDEAEKQHGSKQVIELNVRLPIVANQVLLYRSSSAKGKDFMMLALAQICIQLAKKQQVEIKNAKQTNMAQKLQQIETTTGLYFDAKGQKVITYQVFDYDEPQTLLQQLLSSFLLGQQQALLLNADLAVTCLNAKQFEQEEFEKFWQDTTKYSAYINDPYMQYFWPQVPEFSTHEPLLLACYEHLLAGVKKQS